MIVANVLTSDHNCRRALDDVDNVDGYSTKSSLWSMPHISQSTTPLIQPTDSGGLPKSSPTQQPFFTGYRMGATMSLLGAILVLSLNLIMFLFVWKSSRFERDGLIATLYKGSCAKTRQISLWIHLIINISSTLLLCSSNYCMQILNAPNRQEIEKAHRQRQWLHIGVPSLRNLRYIRRDRALLWVLLCASSVPLHLLFNSLIFSDLRFNNYKVVPTTEAWMQGGVYNTSKFFDLGFNVIDNVTRHMESFRIDLHMMSTRPDGGSFAKYQNFSTSDCFQKYSSHYVADVGNLYIIQDEPTVWRDEGWWWRNDKDLTWYRRDKVELNPDYPTYVSLPAEGQTDEYPSNGWRCSARSGSGCDTNSVFGVPKNGTHWKPYGSLVSHCIVEQVEEACKLRFSFSIALAVIAANLVKVICIAGTLIIYRKHDALITLGDAICSFLDKPDPETRDRCLYGRKEIQTQWQIKVARKDVFDAEPERYWPVARRWASAPAAGRWWATYLAYVTIQTLG
jgi:hypothetical protein